MYFYDLAKSRHSVRAYTDQKVEQEKLNQILETARIAPTAANRQPVRLIVVQEEAGLTKLRDAANCYGAPLAVIVCADHDQAWTRSYDGKNTVQIDATILTDHMMMAAEDLGLGSVWICHFKPEIVREHFNIPVSYEPVNILAIGYPADAASDPERFSTARMPLNELVHYETF